MKKFIVAAVLTATIVTPAAASDWIAPLIGGVIIGSVLNRPNPNVYNGYPNPNVYNGYPNPNVYNPNPLFRDYYNCLVPVRDQYTGIVRNEVMTCMR